MFLNAQSKFILDFACYKPYPVYFYTRVRDQNLLNNNNKKEENSEKKSKCIWVTQVQV